MIEIAILRQSWVGLVGALTNRRALRLVIGPLYANGEFFLPKRIRGGLRRTVQPRVPLLALLAQPTNFCPRAVWTELFCELCESRIAQIAFEGVIFSRIRDAFAGIRVGLIVECQF